MMLTYAAGGLVLAAMGQQSGADLLNTALGQTDDATTLAQVQHLATSGVDFGSAAMIVSVCGIIYKAMQILEKIVVPTAITFIEQWRQRLGLGPLPPKS